MHAAEIGTWFSAQAAKLKRALGFRLVLTVWETIAWRDAYRWPRERGYRRAVLPMVDLCLATTERARDALLLEGVPADRVEVAPPGIDLARFAAAERGAGGYVLSAGRLVWEKGHQDVLRAFALLRETRPDLRLLIVGDGPERGRLESYAKELGVAAEFRATVPYDEMPALYAGAEALVLASLPTKGWEEQFGMVLIEAMACGTPVVACASGAIPEVLGGAGTLGGAGRLARAGAGAGRGCAGRRGGSRALLGRRRGGADGGRLRAGAQRSASLIRRSRRSSPRRISARPPGAAGALARRCGGPKAAILPTVRPSRRSSPCSCSSRMPWRTPGEVR